MDDNIKPEDFPGIDQTLTEIRRMYDLEESRRIGLENKAGILIGVVGIILGIVAVSNLSFTIFFTSLLMTAITLFFAFLTIFPYRYSIPHKRYNEYYQYARLTEFQVNDQFLLDYIKSLSKVEKQNNRKVTSLFLSFLFFLMGIIYLLFSTII